MRPNFDEIAGIENGRDITRGWVGSIEHWLPSQDRILEGKGGGDLELYERVRQDDRVKSCMQQRISGVVSRDWIVSPGGDKRIDRLAADDLREQLLRIEWDRITEKMLWGTFYGYSIAEAILQPEGDRVGLLDIRVRNRRRFKFGIDGKPRLLTFDNPLGEILPKRKFWHFSCGGDNDDDPYGLGLAHWLYWPAWFKRNDLRWWILYLENFVDPAVIGTYPDGASEDEKQKIEGFVRTVGKRKWAAKSSSTLLELLESSRSGTADYQAMYDVLNDAISTIILSQTMTTSDGASLSQAEVHQGVADAVIKSDSDLIASSFTNSIAAWLTDWNFPGAAVPQCYRKLEAETDLKALADRDKVLFDMGFPPNLEYVVETYGDGFTQEDTRVSPIALNTTQLSSFVSLITSAQQSGWSKEMVRTSLEIAFPHVADALLDEMSKSFEQKDAAVDPAGEGGVGIAEVPTTKELTGMSARIPGSESTATFAAPNKKCVKGISYGNTCISASKTCRKLLSPQQRAAKSLIVNTSTRKVADLSPTLETEPVIPLTAPAGVESISSVRGERGGEIPASAYPRLIELINETYADRIDRIVSTAVDDKDNILCVAIDGAKRLAIEIGADDLEIKLIPSEAKFAASENISPDLVDGYAERMANVDPFALWLQQARSVLDDSKSLDEYAQKLESMFEDLPSEDFNRVMTDAMTAAGMGGYFEAESDE